MKLLTQFLSLFSLGSTPAPAVPNAEGNTMSDATVVQGSTFAFHVEARNKAGNIVPITDAAVALSDPALGTVTVNADGTGGVFSSAPTAAGSETMTPSAGGVTGVGFVVDVTADTAVASVAIVSDAVAAVAVVAG